MSFPLLCRRLRLVQFAKGFFFWWMVNSKDCWIATWLYIIFWIYNFILKCLVFACVIFLNRVNFRSLHRNLIMLFTSKTTVLRCASFNWVSSFKKIIVFRFFLYNFFSRWNICSNGTTSIMKGGNLKSDSVSNKWNWFSVDFHCDFQKQHVE